MNGLCNGEERGCAINVVSCHRKICRRTNDWTTSLWKWKRSGNWPAWGGNGWWFVNEAKFYFWKIFSEHTDWFQIFLRWDLLVESKFQFLPCPETKNDGSDIFMFLLDFHPKSLIFCNYISEKTKYSKCRLRRYLNVYFRWVWKVSLDAFVFCENTFCVEIKAEYILAS